ncbi:MAG: hypothetical protein R6V75_03315 [Bacteroidales bacterium]
MKRSVLTTLILVSLVCSCAKNDPGTPPGNSTGDSDFGTITFDFPLPQLNIPDKSLHRVDLSLARTVDSLYRKEFCNEANVSDYVAKYTFTLKPGRYHYQAGITCTCQGDSCLYAGFPGGQLSVWWTSGWVDIEKGKAFKKNLIFQ